MWLAISSLLLSFFVVVVVVVVCKFYYYCEIFDLQVLKLMPLKIPEY